jgi:hypothetical protein
MAVPRLLKIAAICGALPLLAGPVSFVFWLWFRDDRFAVAGMMTACIGALLFLTGCFCLIRQLQRKADGGQDSKRNSRRQTILVVGLLLANVLAAYVMGRVVIDVRTRYWITARNESGEVVDSLIVKAPGTRLELGPLQAGQQTARYLRFSEDGQVILGAKQGDLVFSDIMENRVTRGMSGNRIVIIKAKGIFEVRNAGVEEP